MPGIDTDATETRVREAGYSVLAGALDKPIASERPISSIVMDMAGCPTFGFPPVRIFIQT